MLSIQPFFPQTERVNPTGADKANRRNRPRLVIMAATWTALAVLFVAQAMMVGGGDLPTAVYRALPLWLLWAIATPLVVHLGFALSLERSRLPRSILAHLCLFALIVIGGQWLARALPSRGQGGRPPWLDSAREPSRSGAPPPWIQQRRAALSSAPFAGRSRLGPPGARAALDALIYAILVSVCQASLWSRRARERELRALSAESELATARLEALRMQLNPHFLFNALNGVSTLIHSDPQTADAALGDLSSLLRAALETTDKAEIPLARELEFIRAYLAIEKLRFADRLQFEENVARETLDAMTPTFLLQPLVENAVKHGIESTGAPGRISVAASRVEDVLRLTVSDTGPGFDSARPSTEGHGVGLANTRARLRQLHPNTHAFSVLNPHRGGCEVVIEIPFTVARQSSSPETP